MTKVVIEAEKCNLERPVRLLLFGDVHCDEAACHAIVNLSKQADVVIGVGDYATFRKGLDNTIACLSGIERPTLLVFGNHESREELSHACASASWTSARVLHGDAVTINGQTFFGIGGSTPVTPFGDWSVDVPESTAEELLAKAPENCILISHSPPYHCLDLAKNNQHLGSRSIRQFIETRHPGLAVCGHIHETWDCRDLIGEVPVINPGPKGLLIEY